MKRLFALFCTAALLLSACTFAPPTQEPAVTDPSGSADPTPASTPAAPSTEPSDPTVPPSGWVTENGQTFYQLPDGTRHTGWLELGGTRYYLDEAGILQTGWLELDGKTYYLKSNGSITRGKIVLNNRTYYFTGSGERILLVNPWNFIPADYTHDVVSAENGYMVERVCRDDLLQMLKDCRKAGYNAQITSAWRRSSTQIELYNNKVNYFLNQGYSKEQARTEAAKIIAVPGTSEHELGLAVDLVDNSYWVLDEAQEKTPAQKWLMAHSWEYGFILRYPNNKSEVTGIIYEPWHYRYVGKELAKELHESGLCLEEYLDGLS